MKADFPRLMGRATPLPPAEIPIELPQTSEVSPFIRFTQQKTAESARIYLGKQEKGLQTLESYRISSNISPPLSRMTAKTAELEYQILVHFLKEEKRISNLKKTWGFLKNNFEELVGSLKNS